MIDNISEDRFNEISAYRSEINKISQSMLLKLEPFFSNSSISSITYSKLSVAEKLFAISSRRKILVCEEIRNIISMICDSLIIAREKNISTEDLKYQLKALIKKEKAIFNSAIANNFFQSIPNTHAMHEQCRTNKLNVISSQALMMFEDKKFMKCVDDLLERGSYSLLDEFIADEKDFFYPPLFGDPDNCFANDYLTSVIFFLVCLNDILAVNDCCATFMEKMNCKILKINESLTKRYKLENNMISYLDFSILFSKTQILKENHINNESKKLKIEDSVFFINDSKCDWIIVPNSGYIFGGQSNNDHLEKLVGKFKSTLFYGQDCVSSISGLLDLDYENCDTQNISFFQMLALEFFIVKYGESALLNNQSIEIKHIAGDLEYFISSIEYRDDNILKKIFKKHKMIKGVINKKISSEFGSFQYYDNMSKIFKLESIKVLTKKAKIINYSSISNKKTIRDFIKKNSQNFDLIILINHLSKKSLFENYESYFLDQVSGHCGSIIDYMDDDNILFLGVARHMENKRNSDIAIENSINYSKGGDGLGYQLKSLKDMKFSLDRISLIGF